MRACHTKVCVNRRAFLNELFVYASAFPNKAKLVEIKQDNTLILSRLDGIPYLDADVLSEDIISKLAQSISKFHSIQHLEEKVLCHWDNQPRNILWSKEQQKLWIVDFEDIRLAPPEADIAHLFLFWAEVLDFASFKANVRVFLSHYKAVVPIDYLRWKAEYRKAKARFDRRRKKYNKRSGFDNPDRFDNRKYLASGAMLK
jgi:thiamine kinase-like enzyme